MCLSRFFLQDVFIQSFKLKLKQHSYFTMKNYIDFRCIQKNFFLQYPRKEIAFQDRKECTITVQINKNIKINVGTYSG